MNLASGIFIVPVSGIYYFSFSGVKCYGSSTYLFIHLQVNGVNIGWALNRGGDVLDTISLSASLRLQASDKVNLYKDGGMLFETFNDHSTHFTGWLVEEDLI